MSKDKVIFLSSKNPFSKKDWSGIPFFLYKALSKEYHVEYVLLPQFRLIKLLGYYFSKVFFLVTQKKYVFDYGVILALLYGVVGSIRLRNTKAKFIFSPAGLTEIAFLKSSLPIITYGDCSTLQLIDYYPALMNITKISKWEISFVEQKAFNNTTLSAFSSMWACDFVENQFKKTCSSIPFGSNLHLVKYRLPKSLSSSSNECNLLFIGVDWKRKGGDTVLQVHQQLLEKGVPSRLTIVGTILPLEITLPDFVKIIPNLNKDTKEGVEQLEDLLEQTHFFLLPTFADCTPIVIAEAYSFGIPVLASDTGGIPSMVLDSVTGYLVQVNNAQEYVSKIEYLIANPTMYSSISHDCLKYSTEVFNWDAAIANLKREVSTSLLSK